MWKPPAQWCCKIEGYHKGKSSETSLNTPLAERLADVMTLSRDGFLLHFSIVFLRIFPRDSVQFALYVDQRKITGKMEDVGIFEE